jgi:ankyrin repeat protein
MAAESRRYRVEDENNWDETPLQVAARHNQVAVLTALLERGAEKDAKDSEGDTALYAAAKVGVSRVVECLLTRGASAQLKNNQRQTACQLAEVGDIPLP